jgi:hypothetical protein
MLLNFLRFVLLMLPDVCSRRDELTSCSPFIRAEVVTTLKAEMIPMKIVLK